MTTQPIRGQLRAHAINDRVNYKRVPLIGQRGHDPNSRAFIADCVIGIGQGFKIPPVGRAL